MCQADDWAYEDRLHMRLGEGMERSMCDRETLEDGTQVAARVAVFVHQHVAATGPTLGLHSEGGDRSAEFEIKFTRPEFIALHAEMGRVIEATA